MNDLIKGITVTVDGKELAELCLNQAAFHQKRMEFYIIEHKRMVDVNVSAPADPTNNQKYSGYVDPVEQMRDKVREHRGKAAKLSFQATHLNPGGSYLLSDGDLYTLGIGV